MHTVCLVLLINYAVYVPPKGNKYVLTAGKKFKSEQERHREYVLIPSVSSQTKAG